jgi:predicted DCC family thiol-disulfide oxidoreductase YuxK
LRGEPMTRSTTCTVYFDGACTVCRREIAHYRRQRGSESIAWVDASSCDQAELGPGLDRSVVLSRFYVRNADGTLTSGAAAFVAIWRRLPAFSWLAALASSRPVLALLETGYSIFLRVRPWWRPLEVPTNAAPMELLGGRADPTAGQAELLARSVVRVASAPEESR